MRRLAAAMVIPALAILLAMVFSPQAPGTEAAELPGAAALHAETAASAFESAAAALRCLLSSAREVVTAWAAGAPCV